VLSSRIDGKRIALREGASTKERLIFEFHVPSVQPNDPDDPDHAYFYNAVGNYILWQCDAMLSADDQKRMQIEACSGSSGEELGKEVSPLTIRMPLVLTIRMPLVPRRE
jgi:hypothetical protein